MSPSRYLLCADPFERWNPATDSSLRLAMAALERGHEVDYCDLSRVNWRSDSASYLKALPVQRVWAAQAQAQPVLQLEAPRVVDAHDYHVVLQRKDPPVDDSYRGHAAHFAQLPPRVVQLNNPAHTAHLSEHQLPLRYPAYATPTTVCHSWEDFVQAVRAQKNSPDGEAAAKPDNLFAGQGVEFFKWDAPEAALQAYWQKRDGVCIVQPFLREVERTGDLRILTMNGRYVGCFLRRPAPGKRLANLIHGSTAEAWTPSKRQMEAALVVAGDLKGMGLYLLGLDFIGDFLNEVNITCPTGIPAVNRLLGKRADLEIIDELQQLQEN